jgi:site-specific recombinase XerD
MNIDREIKFYKELLELEGYSPVTVTNYMAQVRSYLKHFENKEKLSDITLEDFEAWLNLSVLQTTKSSKLTAVRSFYYILKIDYFDLDKYNKSRRRKVFLKDFKRVEIEIEYEVRIPGL